MRITSVEAIPLKIPFTLGHERSGWSADMFQTLEMVLVRVETDAGLVGWGDAFAYGCQRAVVAAIEDMIAPKVVGADARDIAGLNRQLQRQNHLWGRYGITIFAISGLDIALWDLAGKAAGKPLVQLLGGSGAAPLPAYASLFRYGDPATVARVTSATSCVRSSGALTRSAGTSSPLRSSKTRARARTRLSRSCGSR